MEEKNYAEMEDRCLDCQENEICKFSKQMIKLHDEVQLIAHPNSCRRHRSLPLRAPGQKSLVEDDSY